MTKDRSMANEQEKKMRSPPIEPIEWEEEEGSPDARMNKLSTDMDTRWILKDNATGKENMDINYHMKVGEFKKIRLFSDPNSAHPMQHPIHIHGMRFLILDQDGKVNNNLGWKDTILVPKGSTADILLVADNPGLWLMHCHIAEHMGAGMMTVLKVT
jgi:FtsP/CotA-like multicopper oxidase with cupredoxin domain